MQNTTELQEFLTAHDIGASSSHVNAFVANAIASKSSSLAEVAPSSSLKGVVGVYRSAL